jgi:hypothetical protein
MGYVPSRPPPSPGGIIVLEDGEYYQYGKKLVKPPEPRVHTEPPHECETIQRLSELFRKFELQLPYERGMMSTGPK